jgi:hypothetical protein
MIMTMNEFLTNLSVLWNELTEDQKSVVAKLIVG